MAETQRLHFPSGRKRKLLAARAARGKSVLVLIGRSGLSPQRPRRLNLGARARSSSAADLTPRDARVSSRKLGAVPLYGVILLLFLAFLSGSDVKECVK
ncbi:hypothetical protein MRX96_047412 [Rhipicephalus microplus]